MWFRKNGISLECLIYQDSIAGPILFNAFLNDILNDFFFYDIENASAHNFADDSILKEQSKVAINWFSSNKMIVPKILTNSNQLF